MLTETWAPEAWRHQCFDTWRGIGDVVTGMARLGYRLHLINIEGSTWRATFSHDAAVSADGFDAGETPWRAVQRAAWETLKSG